MPTITVSETTHDRLKTFTRPGARFVDTSIKNPDGTRTVVVDDEVIERLDSQRASFESYEDVLLRLFNHARAQGRA